MHFDIATLFSLLALQSLALATALPLLMGWRSASTGARHAQACTALFGLGWLCLLLPAAPAHERWLGTLAMGLIGASLSALWLALQAWLGQRRGRRLMLALPLLAALGHLLGTGFSALVFGLQLLLLCLALARPPQAPASEPAPSNRRWRALLFGSLLLLSLLTLWRAYLAAFTGASYTDFLTPDPVNTVTALLSHLALTISQAAMLVAWRGETEREFLRLSQTDGLTGLANRRAFSTRSVELISLARRYREPLVLLMLDLDGFKAINDNQGHEAGDQALQLFARCLREQMRLGDLVARVGGEEFAVLMARTDALGPQALDQRLREALAATAPGTLGFALDFSAGWARLRPGDRGIEDLMRRADTALYEAKRGGRGRLAAEPGADS